VSVSAGLSGPLLRLVFGADTAALGARSMLVLALGLGSFALFGILATVLTSLAHERLSALLTLLALGLVVGLCLLGVRGRAFGEPMLLRTAVATSAGLLLATVLAVAAVRRTAGAVVAPRTALRVALALAAAIGLGRLLPAGSRLLTVGSCVVVAAAYGTLLVATRELGRGDLALVRRVAARRPG
jgi:stage V sporulation protein B